MKGKEKGTLKILFKYFKKHLFSVIISSLVILACSMSYIFRGHLIGAGTEYVTLLNFNKALEAFLKCLALTLIVYEARIIAYYFLSRAELKASYDLSYDTYKKVLKLPAYAFEKMSSGQILDRVTRDCSVILNSFDSLVDLVGDILCVIVIFIYILIQSWVLAIIVIIFFILYGLVMKKYTKLLKENHKKRKEVHDEFVGITNESVMGIREIKTLGITKNLSKKVKKIAVRLIEASSKEIDVYRVYSVLCSVLRGFFEIGIFVGCLLLFYYGKITMTFFIAMTYYIGRFTYVLNCVVDFSEIWQELSVALSRIGEILNNKLYDDIKYGNKELEDSKGIIEFSNVKFGYPKEKILLNDFSVKFEPNKKIAIVGASGEGKSTLFNLITRIFDPIKGMVTLDGIDIRELSEESLRNNISIVRQEPFVFNRSILDNFRLVKPNIKLKEVRKYCELASIDEYIMSLPKKYNTILGEGGVNLSGGQKQRLAIARSLLKESKVILFDEATSALDNESQSFIKNTIDDLVKNHTVIIVAHRLSTIMDADIIYVVKEGKVLTSGTHDYLLKHCDFYKKLYKKDMVEII